MRKSLGFIVFSLFFLLTAEEVMACKCAGRPQGAKGIQTCGYYRSSENIFIGLAEKIAVDRSSGSMRVTFSVERSIKGTNENSVDIYTNASTASCGYPFKLGERYFVYGRKGQDGRFRESLCGPTTLLKDAEDDLAYVKDIEEGKLGTRIYGTVWDDWQPTLKDSRVSKPLPNIEITIKSEKNQFKTSTNDSGEYLFKDTPAENYQVFAKLPNGYRELFVRADLTEHLAGSCSRSDFRVTKQGSIRGRVVNFPAKEIQNPWNRDEIQQPKIELIPLDDTGQIMKNELREEVWAYRDKFEYHFDRVPAGNYLLAMNRLNCPNPNNGMRPTFFPGVSDQAAARVVTVKEGENLVLDNFRSLPLLKERWFEGSVLDSQGVPVPGARVRLFTPMPCSLDVSTETDAEGRFRLKGFVGYIYQLMAFEKPGKSILRSEVIDIPATDEPKSIKLTLKPR